MQHWEREGQGVNLAEWDDSQGCTAFLHNPRPISGLAWPKEGVPPKLLVVSMGGCKALWQTWKVHHPHHTCR